MLVDVQLDRAVRTVSLSELEELVLAGFVGPHTPIRPEGAGRFVAARTMDFYQAAAARPQVRLRERWERPPVAWMTALIVGINVKIFLWSHGTGLGTALVETFSRSSAHILESGQGWRILSYGLLHGGLSHVAMNMLFIAYAGYFLERVIGPAALGALFVSAVSLGGAMATFGNPEAPSIGASGGDFGFLAAAVVTGWRYGDLLPSRARVVFGGAILLFTVWGFGNGLLSEQTDNWGHFGGLIAGGFWVALLRPNVDVGSVRRNRRVILASLLSSALMAAGLALGGPWILPLVADADNGVEVMRPAWWKPGYGLTGGLGVRAASRDATVVVGTSPSGGLDVAARLDEELAAYRAVVPDATLERLPDETRDGRVVTRYVVRWTQDGTPKIADGWMLVRGDYVSAVRLEAEPGWLRSGLLARVDAGIRFPPLEVEAKAAEHFDPASWRAQLERAKVSIEVGDLAEGCVAAREAQRLAPGEPGVPEVTLGVLARCAPGEVPAAVSAAIAAFPGDRRVVVAGARALAAAGEPEAARELAAKALEAAPGSRVLERLVRELGDVGGDVPR